MDGKRLVNQNVNALIPTIAIQRMDIVATISMRWIAMVGISAFTFWLTRRLPSIRVRVELAPRPRKSTEVERESVP